MIKRFLRWLWCPGPCRFVIIREAKLFDSEVDRWPSGVKYVSRCTTCGAIRSKRV